MRCADEKEMGVVSAHQIEAHRPVDRDLQRLPNSRSSTTVTRPGRIPGAVPALVSRIAAASAGRGSQKKAENRWLGLETHPILPSLVIGIR